MPAIRDTYVNPLLTDIYVGYGGEQNYIAGALFPTVEVDKETGIYFVRDKENLRAPADARRGEFSRANRVSNTLSQATYTLEEKTLESPISWKLKKNGQIPFDAKKNATMLVTDKLKLDKEIDLQATILAAGAPGLDASTAWATITTDIVGQVRTGRDTIQKNTGKRPNVAVISKLSLNAVMKNTAFLDSIKYVNVVNEESLRSALAAWFDVPRILIADAINNTAKEGQATDVMDWIWSDNFVLAYVTPTPALEVPTAGYEIKLSDVAAVDEWSEPEIKTDFVRATDYYDNKVVDPSAMYVITNTV
jgi:hypothetical protein